MNVKNVVAVIVLLAGIGSVFTYAKSNNKKTAYVKVGELYDEFDMKKELESTFVTVGKGRQQQLDSLELELKLINKRLASDEKNKELNQLFDERKENYLLKKKQFEEDNAQMQQQFTEKIKKQLNQYVTDYGKENNYDYIFGAEGSGAIMYAKDNDDLTKEVLLYINKKYKGIK